MNYNNVFATIKTNKAFTFSNESEMKSFMKYDFPNPATQPNSAYCLQKVADLKTFECLLVYASGVPNLKFDIEFSFNYKGDSGFLKAEVDPLASAFNTRSLRG